MIRKIWTVLVWPVSLLWMLGCYIKLLLTKSKKADVPIVSIGNIEIGGTGKTPLTIEVAKIIGNFKSKMAIICYAANNKYPDESLVIARAIKKAVIYCGKKRRDLVDKAIKNESDLIIIDDGFQYFDIKNKVDIILLDPSVPLNILIPAGRMRFPARFLKYADAIVVRKAKDARRIFKKFLKKIEAYHKPIFFAEYQMQYLCDLQGNHIPVSILNNKKVIAACGIAKPDGFIEMIGKSGACEIYAVKYPDHFIYSDLDICELEKLFHSVNADMLITTEKDIVKLTKFPIDIPIYSIVAGFEIEPFEEFKDWLINKISICKSA